MACVLDRQQAVTATGRESQRGHVLASGLNSQLRVPVADCSNQCGQKLLSKPNRKHDPPALAQKTNRHTFWRSD